MNAAWRSAGTGQIPLRALVGEIAVHATRAYPAWERASKDKQGKVLWCKPGHSPPARVPRLERQSARGSALEDGADPDEAVCHTSTIRHICRDAHRMLGEDIDYL